MKEEQKLQLETVQRDKHLENISKCKTIKEIDQEQKKYEDEQKKYDLEANTSTYEQEGVKKKIKEYNDSKDIDVTEIILAIMVYFAFSFAFSESLTAWGIWAATLLGVSLALTTILLTAAVMLIWVGRADSYLVRKASSAYDWFVNETDTKTKIEYMIYAVAYLCFLALPFMPFGSVFFEAVLAQATILFEIGTAPTAIILMIVWALIPITTVNGITKEHKGKEKIIGKELLEQNPIHRIRQAIFYLYDSLYLYGVKNPISMLAFSVVFFGVIFDMQYYFLPASLHQALLALAYGVTNAALGPTMVGLILGWYLGLFILVVCDIITRDKSSTSQTLLKCAWLRNHLLDAILFTIALIIGAHLMEGSAVAYVCGNWEIIGLLTINIKPLLGIYDFVTDPARSVIGTCTILLPLMPFTIIMYPELCIEYLLDFFITSIAMIIKYASSILTVTAIALMEIMSLATATLTKHVPAISDPNDTKAVKYFRENLFYDFEKAKAGIAEAYKKSSILKKIAASTGKILNIAYIVVCATVIFCAISAIIPGIVVPQIFSWGMMPVTLFTSYFSLPSAAITVAMIFTYMLALSICNFRINLEERCIYTYLEDNLLIALLFLTICPICAMHIHFAILAAHSAIAVYSFDLVAILFSILPCYLLNSREYKKEHDPIVLQGYHNIHDKGTNLAGYINEHTQPLQSCIKDIHQAIHSNEAVRKISDIIKSPL